MAKRSDSSPATDGGGLEPLSSDTAGDALNNELPPISDTAEDAPNNELPPDSDTAGDAPNNELPPDLPGVSAATDTTQKRGRGRPPKAKSESQKDGGVSAQPIIKPSARPERATASVPTASPAAVVKTGRGRPKRSNPLPAPLVPTVDGSRKRGRPKTASTGPASSVAAPAKKRGRKPKSEEVASKRTVGRPKKATKATTGQESADPRDLKKKAALLQKKVKVAADKLKIAVSAIEEVQKIAAGM